MAVPEPADGTAGQAPARPALPERVRGAAVVRRSTSEAAPDPVVLARLRALRARLPELTGSVAASSDGLLIAHDLPPSIEPSSMAALTASGLALSHHMASAVLAGTFHDVVVHGTEGYVVVYAAGSTASLTVLAGPGANVGRLHLESRPVARAIADHLAEEPPRTHQDDSPFHNPR